MDSLTMATWALVCVTAVYVLVTGRITMQNSRLLEQQNKPQLVAFAEVNENHAAFLVVQNVGTGVARNVRVRAPHAWGSLDEIGTLGEIGFVARGVSTLPAGARVHSMIALLPRIDWGTIQPFPIDLDFQDASGRRNSVHYDIDLREFLGTRPGSLRAPGGLLGV